MLNPITVFSFLVFWLMIFMIMLYIYEEKMLGN